LNSFLKTSTIFLMGEGSFFPDKTPENQDLWYNLCKLPLKPKQTGSTAVYIDYNSGSEYDLELFAKNVEDEKLNFDKEVKNDGYEDATFRPEREITRAEVMSVINRILGRKPLESYVKSLDFSPFNDLEINKWHYVTVLEATITHDYYLNSQNFEHKWENCK